MKVCLKFDSYSPSLIFYPNNLKLANLKAVPLSAKTYEPLYIYLNIFYCMVQHVNEVVNFIIFVR